MSERPDLRFNNRELIGIFIMLIVVSSVIFGLGVFVGKGMSETKALLFLKEQFKKERIAQRPAVDTHEVGTVPPSTTPSQYPNEEKRVPEENGDDGKDDNDDDGNFDGEPLKSGGDDASKVAPLDERITPVAPKKQIRSGGLDIPLGFPKREVDEVLLDGGKGVPYKSEMAKIYKGNSPLFTIVLLNTTDRLRAENLVKSLSGKLSSVYMDVREGENSSFVYRVLLGKYRSKGEATSIATALNGDQKMNRYTVQALD